MAWVEWQPGDLLTAENLNAYEDTGWINLVYTNGWTAGSGLQLQYRKVTLFGESFVYLRGGVDGTIPNDGVYRTICLGGLPIGVRPPTEIRFTGMGNSGRNIGWRITINGNIDIVNPPTGTSSTWASIYTSWIPY